MKIQSIHAISGDDYLKMAQKHIESGNYVEAVFVLKSAIRATNDVVALFELAKLYAFIGLDIEAINYYIKVLDQQRFQLECYTGLSFSLQKIGNDLGGHKNFENMMKEMCKIQFEDDAMSDIAVDIMEDLDIEEEIYPDIRVVTKKQDREDLELVREANNCICLKNYAQALDILLQIQPESIAYSTAMDLAVFALMESGEIQQAFQLAQSNWIRTPNDIDALCNVIKTTDAFNQDISQLLQTAQSEVFDNFDSYMKLGKTFAYLEKDKQAFHFFEKALQKEPYQAYALMYAGVAAFNIRRYNESVHYFETAEILYEEWAYIAIMLKNRALRAKMNGFSGRMDYVLHLQRHEFKTLLNELREACVGEIPQSYFVEGSFDYRKLCYILDNALDYLGPELIETLFTGADFSVAMAFAHSRLLKINVDLSEKILLLRNAYFYAPGDVSVKFIDADGILCERKYRYLKGKKHRYLYCWAIALAHVAGDRHLVALYRRIGKLEHYLSLVGENFLEENPALILAYLMDSSVAYERLQYSFNIAEETLKSFKKEIEDFTRQK